jgi:hypothetical protein
MQLHWGAIRDWLRVALTWRDGVDGLVADEVSVLPGIE